MPVGALLFQRRKPHTAPISSQSDSRPKGDRLSEGQGEAEVKAVDGSRTWWPSLRAPAVQVKVSIGFRILSAATFKSKSLSTLCQENQSPIIRLQQYIIPILFPMPHDFACA